MWRRVFQKSMKKAHGQCTRALVAKSAEDQRFAMYIVISNPNRRSVKAGAVHCMVKLQWVG
jgi:hypothetical protein